MLKKIRPLIIALGLTFIIILITHSWEKIASQLSTLNPPLFILSLLIATAGNLATSTFFRSLLIKYGIRVDLLTGHQVFFFGQIAKYIPGKIWGVVYQRMALKTQGTTSGVVLANIDLTAVQITMCSTVAAAILLFNTDVLYAVLLFISGLIGCHLLTLSCSLRKLSSKLHLTTNTSHDCAPSSTIIGITSYYLFFAATFFGSQFILLTSIFDFSSSESLTYVAFLGLSWVIGVITLISPAGLGVREAVFLALTQTTTNDVNFETIAAIAIIARFWLIIQEFLGVGIIAAFRLFRKR